MNHRPPPHIVEAGVVFTKPEYHWDNETDDEVLFQQPRIANRIGDMSNRAALAFSLGAIEWTFYRLHKMLPDDSVFQFLDAAWAGIVDWRYLDAFIDRPWEEDYDRNIGSPLAASVYFLEEAFSHARNTKPFIHQPVTISEVALRVCGAPDAFKSWRRQTIERLIELCPKDRSARMGRPLPREIVNPGYISTPTQDDENIAAYLASLDWKNNPYLGKPEEMKAAGFEGEPYCWPAGGASTS
ncbi:hypothetical protein SAMN05216359_12226 [Roseateles sp. YR242]|uniref:hypothetical protein n=1 Tax=Roseateles sp. YR242 TaxID=1855305 RepID=UPI0008B44654|nr:hypothetical protein [Roseateles sp. YR242]SEL89445.1 hypothetical protein SAMN05216359_12226 [Roseateles sp. YR242]